MFPVEPGVYAVELWLEAPRVLSIGQLGQIDFPAGTYLYLGSARGPGGLRGRLARHVLGKGSARPHWHIDALRRAAVVSAWAALVLPAGVPAPAGLECRLARLAQGWPGAVLIAPGFGASDCRSGCPAHLVAFPAVRPGEPLILQQPAAQAALAQLAHQVGGALQNGLPNPIS